MYAYIKLLSYNNNKLYTNSENFVQQYNSFNNLLGHNCKNINVQYIQKLVAE